MTPPLFTPYETRIELRCRGGLLALPESVWHKSAHLCGARIVSEYKGVGVRSYILSLSSLFVFESRIVLLCCSQKPFDSVLTFWREVLAELSPYALFIEKRLNPFNEGDECVNVSDRIFSLETVRSFGFRNLGMSLPSSYSSSPSRDSLNNSLEMKKFLMHESWGLVERVDLPRHKVAMMFSPKLPLTYSLIEECVQKLPGLTFNQEFQFTPSGFSSNHLHCREDVVQGYSTVHYSEGAYLSIESCALDQDPLCEGLLFDLLVRRIASEVLPDKVVLVPFCALVEYPQENDREFEWCCTRPD